jgi:hypothetical protein
VVHRVFAALLMPALLAAADLAVDHVTVAGKDLKAMQAALAAVGIETEYGGAHSNHATEMALSSFPDGSYLELIAIQPHADPAAVAAHEWAKLMEGDAGPAAWAIRTKDLGAEVKRLQAAGVTVGTPARSGRQRPDGTRLEWEAAQIGSQPRGTFFPFLIHDFTPREQRVYLTRRKPTTRDFAGVKRVVIGVRNLDDSVKRYRQAFAFPPPIKYADPEFGVQMALLGGDLVVLAAPLNPHSRISERLERFGEGPCAFILAAKNPGRYRAAGHSRWFGSDISWFDVGQLGWLLGFEEE